MARSLTELSQTVVGGISAVTAVVVALQANSEAIAALLQQLGLPSAVWLAPALAVVLFLVGASLLWQGLSRKSRLLWPEALLIDPDNPDHLRGRTDEIRRLSQAVATRPLVFLEGESGSGKSALVRSGLIPALRNPPGESPSPSILPIYLNSYPGDWEESLRESLVDAVWHGLGDERRERLAITDRNTLRSQLLPARTSPLLRRIREELGLIPLLIFDQFDDYQVVNRRQFLRDGRWITAADLTGDNVVWRRIGEQLKRRALHLLFITRRDLFAGLEAVRLEAPETYALDRVEPAYIIALLEQLVARGADGRQVISNPTAGWESLKNRLIRDLSAQGRVLPIQARVVFKGLTELPHLSVGSYDRRGGLEGLEAAYIEDAGGAAARAAGMHTAQLLALLLALVDESDPDLPKARSLSTADLVRSASADAQRIDRALAVLEQEGVVRQRAGDGSAGQGIWSLYHDYLARAVLSAHRRANRWQRLLKEQLRSLNEAGDLGSRWRALLSPWEQLRLIPPTLTGKVHWGGYGGFALLSTARLLPLLAVLVLALIGGDQALDWQARQEADRILTGIRSGVGNYVPKGEEYRQLWTLAAAGPRLKRAFVERSIVDINSHDALLHHIEPVGQSLLGLDPERRLRLESLDFVVNHRPVVLYSAVLAALINHVLPDSEPGQMVLFAELLVDAMQVTSNPDFLALLGSTLGGLSERLPAEQAKVVALRLVEVMGTTTDWARRHTFRSAFGGLGGLGEQLPAEQAKAVALRLLEVMSTTTDGNRLGALGSALGDLGEGLPAEQVKAVALRLVDVMGTTTDGKRLGALGSALGDLGEGLPAEQGKAGALHLVEVMGTTADDRQLDELGSALGRLGWRLPAEQAKAVTLRLVDVMGTTTDGKRLGALGSALGSLGERLPAEPAKAVALRLVEVMGTTTDGEQLGALGSALGDMGWRLPVEQAKAGALRLLEVMGTTTDGEQLGALGSALGGLGERLPAEQVQAAALRLVDVMGTTTDGEQLGALGSALGGLGERLPAEQVQAAALRLVEVMGTTTDGEQRFVLGSALSGLSEWLSAEQAEAVALRLVEVMGTTTDGKQLGALGSALGGLGERLPAEQAKAGALRLVEVMGTTTDGEQLGALGSALGDLGNRLPSEQARAGALRLVEVMGTTTDGWQLDQLGSALSSLGERLPAEQAKAGVMRLMEVVGTTTDSWYFDRIRSALGGLSERLPAEQAKVVALRLVELLGTTTDDQQLDAFRSALDGLSERLPAEQAEAGALRLVEVMAVTIDSNVFVALARALDSLPLPEDPAAMESAADLLQAPMAYGETRTHLLRYYSRLAGVFATDDAFASTDDLVAWVRAHRPGLDLSRLPRNPFR